MTIADDSSIARAIEGQHRTAPRAVSKAVASWRDVLLRVT